MQNLRKIFLKKSKEIFNRKFKYNLVNYKDNKTKIELICFTHGNFLVSPSVHLRTKSGGCHGCSTRTTKSIENFINLFKEKHSNKYDYSLVDNIKNNRFKFKVICHNHESPFIFEQTSYRHLIRGQGCPLCAGKYSYDYEEFIRKADKIHNNKFSYNYLKEDYVDNKTKVRIICSKHGYFWQTPNSHLSGKGCEKCIRREFNLNTFISESNKIHNNKYDYSLVNFNSIKDYITIICPIHGEFKQNAYNHLLGSNCRKCSDCEKYDQESIIEKFIDTHRDRYDYSLVEFKSIREKVKIICKKHGIFEQDPFRHYYAGNGCPICNLSLGEIKIMNYLKDNKIKYNHQHKFDNLKGIKNFLLFDFYLPEYNLCIEFDGKQHYEPIDFFGGEKGLLILQKNDDLKNKYCKENNINLLRIKYDEFDIVEYLIKDKLFSLPKKYTIDYRLPIKTDDLSILESFFNIKFMIIKCITKPNCFENNCHNNVNNYVNMYGGEKITGYYIVYDLCNNRFIGIKHSVWKNTYNEIIDITKFSDNRKYNIFFESNLNDTEIEF